MSPLQRSARRFLGLPRRRGGSEASSEWLPLSDGVRLATTVIRPANPGTGPIPTILIRTPLPAERPIDPTRFFARLLAEDGFNVVLQSCRGRYDSEGRFTHFENEARDGAETVNWIVRQAWGEGPLALVGFGYAGYAAWAALSQAPQRVAALVVGFQGRDPYSTVYSGGALRLSEALRLGVGIGERAVAPKRDLEFERGCEHRPVHEADRVVRRRVESFRTWAKHPQRDEYWNTLTPEIPTPPPAALLIGGWHDPSIDSLLTDHAELRRCAEKSGSRPPELVVGPWVRGRAVGGARTSRREREHGITLRNVSSFLARSLGGDEPKATGVSVFVNGAGYWREFSNWPPEKTAEQVFYLRSRGDAKGPMGNGELTPEEPTSGEEPDLFRCDPEDPVPRAPDRGRGAPRARDSQQASLRADVLRYSTATLDRDLDVLGPVKLILFASSSAPDGDFAVRLVDVAPDGSVENGANGIARCRWQSGGTEPVWFEGEDARRIEIELRAVCCRFRAGHRLRIEVAATDFPRFDRNPNTHALPESAAAEEFAAASQVVYHDADRPSRLVLPVLAN